MSIQDVIAIALAGGALFYVVRMTWRSMSGRGGCGCGSGKGTCSASTAGSDGSRRDGITRRSFVSLDLVGKPSSVQREDSEG